MATGRKNGSVAEPLIRRGGLLLGYDGQIVLWIGGCRTPNPQRRVVTNVWRVPSTLVCHVAEPLIRRGGLLLIGFTVFGLGPLLVAEPLIRRGGLLLTSAVINNNSVIILQNP